MKSTITLLVGSVITIFLNLFIFSCTDEEDPKANDTADLPLELNSFSPLVGMEGTEITITGNNFFNKNSTGVDVTVNGVNATITDISNSQIKLLAPKNNRGIEAEIVVTNGSISKSMTQKFMYAAPEIDDFYPKEGLLFEDIVIKGKYFSNKASDVEVTMDGYYMAIKSSTPDSIVIQNNDPSLIAKQLPISITIDGATTTSSSLYTFNMQFNLSNVGFNSLGFCPGSTIEMNITDNRDTTSGLVISSYITPLFTFNGIEPISESSRTASNNGRNIRMPIPTSIPGGSTAQVSSSFNGIELIPPVDNSIAIGDGFFSLESNQITYYQQLNIYMSHHFIQDMLTVVFTDTVTNSETIGGVIQRNYSESGALILSVQPPDVPGTYSVSVKTADGNYELKPLNSTELIVTN